MQAEGWLSSGYPRSLHELAFEAGVQGVIYPREVGFQANPGNHVGGGGGIRQGNRGGSGSGTRILGSNPSPARRLLLGLRGDSAAGSGDRFP